MNELKWLKSSHSEASGNACIEFAACDESHIAIRDSVYPRRHFSVGRRAFTSFVTATRSELFHHGSR
ncbi:DUF397 domain-containing protein [Streptomyces sp. enrichment culture]|uniref:DUF397 domain-containing protein n=1 Tax=Streptomyces sp. enrichment culture TaxID=1795815 RepID=UPI003F551B14